VVFDTNEGLFATIRESFPALPDSGVKTFWLHVPQKEKDTFAAQPEEIWLAPSAKLVRQRAKQLSARYGKRFQNAIKILEEGLENSLVFCAFSEHARKISSTNILE